MIKILKDENEILPLIYELYDDVKFSNPLLESIEKITIGVMNALYNDDCFIIGVYDNAKLIGVFSFIVEEKDKFMELLFGYSKYKKAYQELFSLLSKYFIGYNCDFLINPNNDIFYDILLKNNAIFYPKQFYMVLEDIVKYKTNHVIIPYNDKYKDDYLDIHEKQMYWTGDKVILEKNKFKVLLALDNDNVVGYIDYTYCYKTCEPYSILVKEEYRNKGYGKALLYNAIMDVIPRNMHLRVDFDNLAAINMYKQLGFVIDEGNSSVLVNLNIK